MDTDLALILRFMQERREAVFRTLYDRHAGYLRGFALRLSGGDDAVSDEVTQETWLRAVRRLGDFGGRSAFRSWLCGIALNAWRERTRQTARRSRLSDAHHVGEGVDGTQRGPTERVDPAGHAALRLDLLRAIEGLPPGSREVLLLHDVEGFTHVEIGQMLDISDGTSKSQLSRARSALRIVLSDGPAAPQEGV